MRIVAIVPDAAQAGGIVRVQCGWATWDGRHLLAGAKPFGPWPRPEPGRAYLELRRWLGQVCELLRPHLIVCAAEPEADLPAGPPYGGWREAVLTRAQEAAAECGARCLVVPDRALDRLLPRGASAPDGAALGGAESRARLLIGYARDKACDRGYTRERAS